MGLNISNFTLFNRFKVGALLEMLTTKATINSPDLYRGATMCHAPF